MKKILMALGLLAGGFAGQAFGMEIGWAERDITPPLGGKKIGLAGLYYVREATNVQSRLKFTCCVIRKGGEQVLMGSLDSVSGWDPFSRKVASELHARIPEIREESVFIGCPHVHSAPYLRPCYTPAADKWAKAHPGFLTPNEYAAFVLPKVVDAFAEAWRNAKPGSVARAFGSARIGHCRIALYRDGTSEMYGDTRRDDFAGILEGEDSGVEMLFTCDASGRKTGVFLNVACPSQVMEQTNVISSDFAGATRDKLAKEYGEDFRTIYHLGAAGCQSPRDLMRPKDGDDFSGWDEHTLDVLSDRLVAAVKAAMPKAIACADALTHRVHSLKLPIRRVTADEVAAARAELAKLEAKWPGETAWEDYMRDVREHERTLTRWPFDTKLHPYAVMDVHRAVIARAELQERQPFVDAETHIARIGDVAFVSNPFELYLAFGQIVKARSAAKQTFLIGKCGSSGYVPTERSEKAVGYSGGVNVGKIGHVGGQAFCDAVVSGIAAQFNDPYDYKELVVRNVDSQRAFTNSASHVVVDFGRDAVGWLEVGGAAGPFEIVIGEMTNAAGRVANPYPGSTIRVQTLKGEKPEGWFRPAMKPDRWNLTGYAPSVSPAIRLPDHLGLVFPFRYAEIVRLPSDPLPARFVQKAVNYPIDLKRSAFACSDESLVRVYDFCKYSVLATSFTGIYVDGDRERTPYEADAYINQMAHYAIDDDLSMARRSFEWLMVHPTWPTEWKQHMIKMAWADWMWTGDTRSVAKFYDRLRDVKLMRKFARASDGLLETGGELKKGAKPGAADIVDWPEAERNGFEFRPVNAVVNAFFVRNLEEMRDLAAALGKSAESQAFAADAVRMREAYQKAFFDPKRGLYVDGEGATHVSVQANAAALAFGLVPPDRIDHVADWLVSCGMGCSTYFSQYLLEALFVSGRDEAAIALMTARDDRSWIGMMDFGSTITMESWNMKVKPNQDLNHAWSATPLSMISRFVLGVTPLEPGFSKVAVRPQIGKLKMVSGTVPTVKGPVKVEVRNGILHVDTPVPAKIVWQGRTYDMSAGVRNFPTEVLQ